MAKWVPPVILINPAEHAQTSKEEKATKSTNEASHQADMAYIRLLECFAYMQESVLWEGSMCSRIVVRATGTYKGKNVAEAEVVRIRTPMQTDAMLKAAVLRRFVSFNLPKESLDKLLATLTEMNILRILRL